MRTHEYTHDGEYDVITGPHANHVFEYYALEPEKRSPDLYNMGCSHVSNVVNTLYESLILDNAWSDRSKELFEAVNCGNIVERSSYEGPSRQSDLKKQHEKIIMKAEHLVVLKVCANAKLYWDRERELHAYSLQQNVKYTSDDPGPYLEYERRFLEAAEDNILGSVDVTVRKLVDGDAVSETVRAVQKFVVENSVQYQMIHALYQLCVWHFFIQHKQVGEWQNATDKESFALRWADRMNKKIKMVKLLAKIVFEQYSVSTVSMEQEIPKKTSKAPTKFDRFYSEKKGEGSKLTKKELRVHFDALTKGEKELYGNPEVTVGNKRKMPGISKKNLGDKKPAKRASDEGTGVEAHNTDSETDDDEDQDYDMNDEYDSDADVSLTNEEEDSGDDGKERESKSVTKPSTSSLQCGGKNVPPKKKIKTLQTAVPPTAPVTKMKKRPEFGKAPLETAEVFVDRDIHHELVRDTKEHFLWELFSHNMNGMISAKKPFTPFERTVFEAAYKQWKNQSDTSSEDEKFKAAMKELSKTPGIVHCFQFFNLLFKPNNTPREPEEDYLMG